MTTPINTCPDGGIHTFIMGGCFKCGISIRVHKERVKAHTKAKHKAQWQERKARLMEVTP